MATRVRRQSMQAHRRTSASIETSSPARVAGPPGRVATRTYTPERDLRIVVDSDLSTVKSHEIVAGVRHALFHLDPKMATVMVHADPSEHGGVDHHMLTADHTARSRQLHDLPL
jgi:hypothetical protein